MNNEVYALALKSTLQEIQNACPDVTSNFIFNDGKILAQDKNTNEETATQTIAPYNAIAERADILGGLETITIQSAEGKVNITTINDFHLTTVSSNEADEKYVNTLTRILIPIVIKLVEQIQPASTDNETITIDQTEPEEEDTTEEIVDEPNVDATEETVDETADDDADTENYQPYEPEEETTTTEPYEETEPAEINYEPLLPEPPVTQLIVENLSGFRVPSDTVRVDTEVIAQWNELYSDKKINEVEVEALNGKTTRCKFNPIKKSKDTGKGIIKMPEKIQLTLETVAGELVTVKPVVE
ncbi:hypothetical protein JXA31_04185 [Candidatus Bathyarchaeota archaeon]|nr:hypothetical protein [Candidatus Bathyarchaeota archaeon]